MYFWWWHDGGLGQGLEPFFDAMMFLDLVSFGRKEIMFLRGGSVLASIFKLTQSKFETI